MNLFIDTHFSRKFSIGTNHNGQMEILTGANAAKEMMELIDTLTQNKITKIFIIKGPGSLTGLRIGSSCAMGIACAKNIPIFSLSIWDLLLSEHPDADIFFYTGTKKWIKKNLRKEKIIEENFRTTKQWISNKPEKLETLPEELNIRYPQMIPLMMKYQHLATENMDLLYPVTLF